MQPAKILIGVLAFFAWAVNMSADQPPAKPERLTFKSPDGRLRAVSDPATNKTSVYSGSASTPLWQIDGWFPVAFLSDAGTLIVGNEGSNLLPKNYRPTDPLLRFYQNGALKQKVSVMQVVDQKSMRPTASHYYWGSYLGIYKGQLQLELVDGRRIAFNPDTGEGLASVAK
jgi:hypothetical protein